MHKPKELTCMLCETVTDTRHLTHSKRLGCWPNPFYPTLNSEEKVRANLDTGCYGLHPKSRLLESVKLKRG